MISTKTEQDLSRVLRPVAPPRVLDTVFSADEEARILKCIRSSAPWEHIFKKYFASTEEVRATSGGVEGSTIEQIIAPTFHGTLAHDGICFHREIEDIFLSPKLLDLVRDYWGVDHAMPTRMFLNINGPTGLQDPGHVDIPSFRGAGRHNLPLSILSVMAKSGLFQPWLIKMGQIVTWWYKDTNGGGFTYWPNGPLDQPRRIAPPMSNKGIIVQNEMMVHRAEENGAMARRRLPGLSMESTLCTDAETADGWLVKDGGKVLDKIAGDELRIMLHWNAEVFYDHDDIKRHYDHSDDLTLDRVYETLMNDLRTRGHRFTAPSDPARDQDFIALLSRTYDCCVPRIYPDEAQPMSAVA